MSKIICNPLNSFEFNDKDNNLKVSYIPSIDFDDKELLYELGKIEFERVNYISRFGKANLTPRFTWCYGRVDSNTSIDKLSGDDKDYIINKYNLCDGIKYLSLPNNTNDCEPICYKGLNFITESMPDWLEKLSLLCRKISIEKYNFDPEYNSCIIGRYDDGNDQIGFHFDTESFLTHHFCANVTLGFARDFQFKDESKQLYEIKLQNKSVFFFSGMEHSLPKRAGVKSGQIRYSISFRNMKNDIGIGNSYYYCRGLAGAVNDDDKIKYQEKLKTL